MSDEKPEIPAEESDEVEAHTILDLQRVKTAVPSNVFENPAFSCSSCVGASC